MIRPPQHHLTDSQDLGDWAKALAAFLLVEAGMSLQEVRLIALRMIGLTSGQVPVTGSNGGFYDDETERRLGGRAE